MSPLSKNTFLVTDLTEQRWVVTAEGSGPDLRYRITPAEGEGEYETKKDPRAMHAADFWDVVSPGKQMEKLESLVDSENATAIGKIFDKKHVVPRLYKNALESYGVNGWTLLYRAVLLNRRSETISALVQAGADLAQSQGFEAHPYREWTPVAVALARQDERLVKALFDSSPIDHDLVVGAFEAARIVDQRRGPSPSPSDLLERAIASSPAASGWLKYDNLVDTRTAKALDYAAQFLRVPADKILALIEAVRDSAVGPDLFSSETALSLSLIRRDRDRFEQLVRSAQQLDELKDCARFLDEVKTVPGGERWEAFHGIVGQARARLRQGARGAMIPRKRQ